MRRFAIYKSGWISARLRLTTPQRDSQRSRAIIGTVIKADRWIPIHIIRKKKDIGPIKRHTQKQCIRGTLICRHENARKNRNMMISSSISLRH
jgi:hypothetical protein